MGIFVAAMIFLFVLGGRDIVLRRRREKTLGRKHPLNRKINGQKAVFSLLGMLVGGIIGFTLRPSIPSIGQLPFEDVIEMGGNFQSLDPRAGYIALISLLYMASGLILGLTFGSIAVELLHQGEEVSIAATAPDENKLQSQSTPVIPKQVELNQSPEQVVNVLGQPEKIVNLGAKVTYIYKDMKVIFVDGKVSDVQ